MKSRALSAAEIPAVVDRWCSEDVLIVDDRHTHMFPPMANLEEFGAKPGGLLLYLGQIEDELTYHYVLRRALALGVVTPEQVSTLTKREIALIIWNRMFVSRRGKTDDFRFVGMDEGVLGVQISMLKQGYDPDSESLDEVFAAEAKLDPDENLDRAMRLAGVRSITMTNTPTDPDEARFDEACYAKRKWDPRFRHALRLDPVTLHLDHAGGERLRAMGYDVNPGDRSRKTADELTRFLDYWADRFPDVQYAASSFGPEIDVANEITPTGWVMNTVVLPWCEKHKVPFFLMPGPRRQLQKSWGPAGDGMGLCEFSPYQQLVKRWACVEFLLSVLHPANQSDATVLACHNGNVTNIGHWWFNLAPDLVKQVLAARLQLLGTHHIAFNSDARVKGNLISKWIRFRRLLAEVLTRHFLDQLAHGLTVTEEKVSDCVLALFQGPKSGLAKAA